MTSGAFPPSSSMSISVRPEVVFKEVAGEGVLLDLTSGLYFGLDATSTRLWQLIQQHGRLTPVIDDMLAEFEVDAARLHEDVAAFVRELARRNLVSVEETGNGRTP